MKKVVSKFPSPAKRRDFDQKGGDLTEVYEVDEEIRQQKLEYKIKRNIAVKPRNFVVP